MRTGAGLFVLGALAGTLCDQIHVVGHVLHYPGGGLLGVPWWVFVQYGFAAVAFTVPCGPLVARFGLVETRGTAREVALGLAWFVGAYAASVIFQRSPELLGLALVASFAVRVARDGGVPVVVHALGCMAGGVLWEVVLSREGGFTYDAPVGALGVPWWLPGLYLHAALLTRQLARLSVRPATE